MDPNTRGASPANDIAYGTFYGAAIGGSLVALFFLVIDTMAGQPLRTPSVLGSLLFLGASPEAAPSPSLAAVAYFTVAHFVAFGVLGFVGTILFRESVRREAAPALITTVVLFLIMQSGWLVADATFFRGVMGAIGTGAVLAANGMTALAMAAFYQTTLGPKRERVRESEEELVEGPTLT